MNLPYLDIIRERNKPVEPARKAKTAPFFLPAVSTLDGFEFEKVEIAADDVERQRNVLMAKRSVLEIESSFVQTLLQLGVFSNSLCRICLFWCGMYKTDFPQKNIF